MALNWSMEGSGCRGRFRHMSRRGENIHKRKDGRWEGRIKTHNELTGTTTLKSIYGKTYRDVKNRIMIYVKNPENQNRPKSKCTFGDVLDLWLNENRVRLKGGTVNKYYSIIHTHIIPVLGKVPMNSLTAGMINSFLAEKLEQGRLHGEGGLSPSYVRTIMLVIKAAHHFAVENNICAPLAGTIYKPAIPKKDMRILSQEEQKKLEDHLRLESDALQTGIFLSLHAGLRLGEICALSWKDVDLDNKVLHIRHTVARVMDGDHRSIYSIDTPKTKSSFRDIPISSVLYDVLFKRRKTASSEYVISDKKGFANPRTFEQKFHRTMKKASLQNINFHALRHTFATRCIEAGVDVKSLSEILGHANAAITLNTYVHSSMEMKRTQIEKLCTLRERA